MKIIILTLLILAIYFFIRNLKVGEFRIHIINLIHKKCRNMITDGVSDKNISDLRYMLDDISYEKMLFSFKPLKMEYWFTDDELKLLGYETNPN